MIILNNLPGRPTLIAANDAIVMILASIRVALHIRHVIIPPQLNWSLLTIPLLSSS